jgi:hypothetical protein
LQSGDVYPGGFKAALNDAPEAPPDRPRLRDRQGPPEGAPGLQLTGALLRTKGEQATPARGPSYAFPCSTVLGLREAPLGLPAARGFRWRPPVNRIQFAFRIDPLGPRRSYDHGSRRGRRGPAGSDGRRHWPGETITLRQGARVIEDSHTKRLA